MDCLCHIQTNSLTQARSNKLSCSVNLAEMKYIFILFILAHHSSADLNLTIQAEDGASTSAIINYRSGATNGLDVFLKQGGVLTLIFQLIGKETCTMSISNIQYSNDGLSDELTLEITGYDIIGKVVTRPDSRRGLLWNTFIPTGPVGKALKIGEGVYNLTITATAADEYGVEIDYVSLLFANCSNKTMTAKVVRHGFIHYVEHQPICHCEPCAELTTYGIISICLNCVTCITTIIAILTPVLMKFCRRKNEDIQHNPQGVNFHIINEEQDEELNEDA